MRRRQQRKEAPRIFLSYAEKDKVLARKLQNILAGRGNIRIFSSEALSAGEDWSSRIREELSSCDIFVVLMSPKSIESSWVLQGIGAAWAMNKRIVAVATHPSVPVDVPSKLGIAKELNFIKMGEIEKPGGIEKILGLRGR